MIFKGEQKEKELLIKIRHEEEEKRAKLLAEKIDFPYLDLSFIPIESDALKLIPKEKAEKAKTAIINREAQTLHLAVLNPDDKETQSLIAELQKSNYAIKIFIVSENSLEKALSYYIPLKETATPEDAVSLMTGLKTILPCATSSFPNCHSPKNGASVTSSMVFM